MLFTLSFWIAIAIVLMGLEILIGTFTSLAFGVSALVMAMLIYASPNLVTSWALLLLIYAIVGLILSILMWYLFGRKNKSPDINE